MSKGQGFVGLRQALERPRPRSCLGHELPKTPRVVLEPLQAPGSPVRRPDQCSRVHPPPPTARPSGSRSSTPRPAPARLPCQLNPFCTPHLQCPRPSKFRLGVTVRQKLG